MTYRTRATWNETSNTIRRSKRNQTCDLTDTLNTRSFETLKPRRRCRPGLILERTDRLIGKIEFSWWNHPALCPVRRESIEGRTEENRLKIVCGKWDASKRLWRVKWDFRRGDFSWFFCSCWRWHSRTSARGRGDLIIHGTEVTTTNLCWFMHLLNLTSLCVTISYRRIYVFALNSCLNSEINVTNGIKDLQPEEYR